MRRVIWIRGITLVETAVSLAFTGILAGIALPLIQDTREEARQIACANRLVEITMGSLQYQELNGRMPPLTTGVGPLDTANFAQYFVLMTQNQNTGALAYILPFIGEQKLFDLMPAIATQPDETISLVDLLKDNGMNAAYRTQFESVICPSNADYLDEPIDLLFVGFAQMTTSQFLHFLVFPVSEDEATSFGRTSYLPSAGGFHIQANFPSRAIALSIAEVASAMRNRETSIHTDDLGDGASNTICWSESLGYIANNGVQKRANSSLLSTALVTGNRWSGAGVKSLLFGNSNASLPMLIGSNHIKGNNVTFNDGSVRFLSAQTSRGVMAALGCGDDGWLVPRTE
jgi:type II secretory pathway pseudopilin PulG